MKFEEIGKYLDSLDIDKKLDQVFKVLEDFANPKINVESPKEESKPRLAWLQCAPRVFYKCIQLTHGNAIDVRKWLLQTGTFDQADVVIEGINTDFGEILWGDWIIQEPNNAIVFADNDEFEKQYILNR